MFLQLLLGEALGAHFDAKLPRFKFDILLSIQLDSRMQFLEGVQVESRTASPGGEGVGVRDRDGGEQSSCSV